jgi:hypothetical protein
MNLRFLPHALATVFTSISLLLSLTASAHCDTLDGPVVTEARQALEKGDVTPLLKWVPAADEAEIRKAFQETLAVRSKGPEAKDLADRSFLETFVRIHRAGEGAPYTGLKPAGEVPPGIALGDKALEKGSAEDLLKIVQTHLAEGLKERLDAVVEAKKHAAESVQKGREFVAAYVIYIHYVEALVNAIHGAGGDGEEKSAAPHGCGHLK